MMRSRFLLLALLVTVAMGTGCSNTGGDTSGYKPEPMLTKAQADQQITDVKADKSMPDGFKQLAIQKIEKQTSK